MLLLPEELQNLIKYRVDYDNNNSCDIVHMHFKAKGLFGREKVNIETYKLTRTCTIKENGTYSYRMRDEFHQLINQLSEYVRLRFEGYKVVKKDSRDWMDYQLEKQDLGELNESDDKK